MIGSRLLRVLVLADMVPMLAANPNRHLESNPPEDPPPDACVGSPISIGELRIGEQTTWISLANPTETLQRFYLVQEFDMAGSAMARSIELEVRAGRTLQVESRFSGRIPFRAVRTCVDRPGGVVESPDPVMTYSVSYIGGDQAL